MLFKKIFVLLLSVLFLNMAHATDESEVDESVKESRTTLDYADPADKKLIDAERKKVYDQANATKILDPVRGLAGSDAVGETLYKVNNYSTIGIIRHFYDNEANQSTFYRLANEVSTTIATLFLPTILLLSLVVHYVKRVVIGKLSLEPEKLVTMGILSFVVIFFSFAIRPIDAILTVLPEGVAKLGENVYKENPMFHLSMLAHDPSMGLKDSEIQNVLEVAQRKEDGTDTYFNVAVLQAMTTKVKALENVGEDDSGYDFLNMTLLKRLVNSMMNMPTAILSGIINIAMVIVKYIIIALVYAMDRVLIVFGPLAFLVSFLTFDKDQWITWLKRWLTIKCTLVTLVVIDQILNIVQQNEGIAAIMGANFISVDVTIAVQLIVILMYVMSFWLTSAWIGSSSAGAFLSAAAGYAMGGVGKLAGKVGTKLGSGGPGGGGSEGGAASTAANIAGKNINSI